MAKDISKASVLELRGYLEINEHSAAKLSVHQAGSMSRKPIPKTDCNCYLAGGVIKGGSVTSRRSTPYQV